MPMKRVSILAAGVLSAAIITTAGPRAGELTLHFISMNHFAQKLRCLRQTRLMIATCLLVWLLSSNLKDQVSRTSF